MHRSNCGFLFLFLSLYRNEIRHGTSERALFPASSSANQCAKSTSPSGAWKHRRAAICPGNNRRSVHFRTLRDECRATHREKETHTRVHMHSHNHTHIHTNTHTHARTHIHSLVTTFMQSGAGRKDSCTWGYSRHCYCMATDFLLRVLQQ